MHAIRVLIIRHGEKPGDPGKDNPEDGMDLSKPGYKRAAALATWIPEKFGKPDFLFATAKSEHSNRPVETITPLADKLGMAIDHQYADEQFKDLAKKITDKKKYGGKLILICWHHGKIPKLTKALGGVPPQDPWPDKQFDRVWSLEIPDSGDGSGLPVEDIHQMPIPKDS